MISIVHISTPSMRHHTTVLERNKKNKAYSINTPKSVKYILNPIGYYTDNKVQLQIQKYVLNILILHLLPVVEDLQDTISFTLLVNRVKGF